MQATIDMTGLPEALAIDLENQMLAMVEKAKADMPVSFHERIEKALNAIPDSEGSDVRAEVLVPLIIVQLQAHFDKLGFTDVLSDKAASCVNWDEELFDATEFEHQVSAALNRFFL